MGCSKSNFTRSFAIAIESIESDSNTRDKVTPNQAFSANIGDLRHVSREFELCESRDFDMRQEDGDSDDRIEGHKRDFQSTSEDDDEIIMFGDSDDGSRVFRLEVASIMEGNGATVVKINQNKRLTALSNRGRTI